MANQAGGIIQSRTDGSGTALSDQRPGYTGTPLGTRGYNIAEANRLVKNLA